LLRVNAALGPLQDIGVSAALTFQLADGPDAGTTKLTVGNCKVNGSACPASTRSHRPLMAFWSSRSRDWPRANSGKKGAEAPFRTQVST